MKLLLINNKPETANCYVLLEGTIKLFGTTKKLKEYLEESKIGLEDVHESQKDNDPEASPNPLRISSNALNAEQVMRLNSASSLSEKKNNDGIKEDIDQNFDTKDSKDENKEDIFNNYTKQYVEPGECFGDFSHIYERKYAPCYAIVESQKAKILQFNQVDVNNLVKKLASSAKFEGLIQFITSVIPSFAKMSALARDRMGRCFRERHFLPGMRLVEEGQRCNKMHLIMKGDVLLQSTKSPLEIEVNPKGHFEFREENKLMTKKGYISDTLNSFQIGIKFSKQWIGEECLILDQGNYLYSAVAKNNVSTLEISDHDFKVKFPRDYISKLTSASRVRYEYLIDRMKCITKSSKQIYECVEKQGLYNEVYRNTKEKHPNASKNVLISIGNYNLNNIDNLVPSSLHQQSLKILDNSSPQKEGEMKDKAFKAFREEISKLHK